MSDKYQNKYRIESARLQSWDYGWNASYFVTICTQEKVCFFGVIEDDKMSLSRIGQLADKLWLEIPKHFPYVKLENHIVMPNHIHGILTIDKNTDENDFDVETRLIASLQTGITIPGGFAGIKNPMLNDNLSRIIRWYKGRTTYECRKIHSDFTWQTRFHDHIIRDEESLKNITEYIIQNPARWKEDKFYR